MLTTPCPDCEAPLEGADLDDQVAAALAHFTAEHPHFGLGEPAVRNYLERLPQLDPPRQRVDAAPSRVEVVPCTPDRVDDVLEFFDRRAFANFPVWSSCYCMALHFDHGGQGEGWGDARWQDNRAALAERLRSGRTQAVLAYVDGVLAGWLNASPRAEYPMHAHGDDEDQHVGVAACFVIDPAWRRHGLARRLLDAAVERFDADGMEAVEGYPGIGAVSEQSFRGTVGLFAAAGFEPAGRDEGTRVEIMRRRA